VHEGVSPLYCYWPPIIAEVDELECKSSNEAAVNLCGVEEGQTRAAILAFGCEMRHVFWRVNTNQSCNLNRQVFFIVLRVIWQDLIGIDTS